MKAVKYLLKKFSLYKIVRQWYRRFRGLPIHPLQTIPTSRGVNIIHLGSSNCGWSFVDDDDLYGCTIISAGLGEDASFDLEFAKKYSARVVIVDPTPRAIVHYNNILTSLGNKKSVAYSDKGTQPIEAYDLRGINPRNLMLVEKALYSHSSILKFYQPQNPHHVSCSISNFQNHYRNDTPSFDVQSISVPELLDELSIDPAEISMIKLDIEGAEIEVLNHCLLQGILPRQILVEYDELNIPSARAYERIDHLHQKLSLNGYDLIRTDGQADFLYLRTS